MTQEEIVNQNKTPMKEQIEKLIREYSNEHDRLVVEIEKQNDIQAALHLSGKTSVYNRIISDIENLLKSEQ